MSYESAGPEEIAAMSVVTLKALRPHNQGSVLVRVRVTPICRF